jgi:protein gp37
MATRTGIEWTETTWNPTTGCDRISPGCDHCYALTLARRLKAMGVAKYQNDGDPRTSGPGFGVMCHEDVLLEPLAWRKPRTVFVNSMSDIGHARVPVRFVARIWAVMALTPQHSYQVLTKRPERLVQLLGREDFRSGVLHSAIDDLVTARPDLSRNFLAGPHDPFAWPVPNAWIGTSIETDRYVRRADALRAAPAATRFLSLEPLLGPLPSLDLTGIDWVIAGGESGPGHRPVDLDWIRDLRDRCSARGIAFFFKQVGGPTPKAGGRDLDGRTWDQMPALAG